MRVNLTDLRLGLLQAATGIRASALSPGLFVVEVQ